MRQRHVYFRDVLKEHLKNPSFRREYERIGPQIELAVEISARREGLGMTQKQLAKAVGTAQTNISRIERGDQNLTLGYVAKIASALNCEFQVHLRPQREHSADARAAQRAWAEHSSVADRESARVYFAKRRKERRRSKIARKPKP